MRHAQIRILLLPAALALLLPAAAYADHFLSRRVVENGKERGVVVSHGMDLFDFRTAGGGNTPAHRAEIVAERLEDIAEASSIDPESIRIGTRNGVVVLQQQVQGESAPHIILTLDSATAGQASAEKRARWWLALLRDHLALAAGKPPIYTAGSPVNTLFKKLYTELGEPTEPVTSDQIDHALQALSPTEREAFSQATVRIPASFAQNRDKTDLGNSADSGDAGVPVLPETTIEPKTSADTPPRPRTGQNAKNKRVQINGPYRVELLTNPSTLAPGEPAILRVRLSRTADDGTLVEEAEATVRGWFTRTGETPARPVPADFDKEAGAYSLQTTLRKAGEYTLILGVLTDTADAFKVRFPFTIAPSEPAGNDQAADKNIRNSRRDARTRKSGNYEINLTLHPTHPTAGDSLELSLDLHTLDTQTQVKNATVRIWLLTASQEIGDVDPITIQDTDDAGIYKGRYRLAKAGARRLVVRVKADDDKPFQVEFPITVSAPEESDKPDTVPETSDPGTNKNDTNNPDNNNSDDNTSPPPNNREQP